MNPHYKAAELVIGFLEFYANHFKSETQAIDVSQILDQCDDPGKLLDLPLSEVFFDGSPICSKEELKGTVMRKYEKAKDVLAKLKWPED